MSHFGGQLIQIRRMNIPQLGRINTDLRFNRFLLSGLQIYFRHHLIF